MADAEPYLRRMADRFADPGMQPVLEGFTRTIQFTFSDTHESWLIRANEGGEAVLARGATGKPDIAVTTTTDTLIGIMDKRINAAAAYLQRKIQVKGAMEDLIKLQKLMM